jgi:5'-deoxynucleotidase YfbR-like HD superfamily hydrolase
MYSYGKWLNNTLNGMRNINRWEGKQKIGRYTDSEHTFDVLMICDALVRVEREIFGSEVSELTVYKKALLHDVSEVVLGDIKSGVKRKSNAMREALEDIEHTLYEEELEPLIPESWREEYKDCMLNPKDGKTTIEGRIIAAADSIDALFEAIQEVHLGNRTFEAKLEEVANSILDIDLASGRHFIYICLKDFGLPLKMYGARVSEFLKTYNIQDDIDNI